MVWNMSSLFVIGLMTLMFIVNVVIALLNFSYRNQPLPKNVRDIFSDKELKKSKAYFTENMFFSLGKSVFNFILLIVLFVLGFFPWVAQVAESLTNNTLIQSLIFFFLLILGNSILSAPFNYYQTFSIETRFGFNKTTRKLFFTDLFRNLLLSTLLTAGIGVLLHAIYLGLGDAFVLVSWLTVSALITVIFMLNTKVFVKIFNKLTPLPEGSLKTNITTLAQQTGFKAKAIYSMDASKRSSKLNAFFSGFGPIREIALFDTLINKLKEREILAVLAHEIGHAKHFDELRLLAQQTVVMGLYVWVMNIVVSDGALAQAFGFSAPFFAFGLILFSILVEPLDFIIGLPQNYLSRRAEYAADAFAVKQGYQQEMLSALKVLVKENYSNLTPHPLQVLLTYSHPPMHQRIAAIEKLSN